MTPELWTEMLAAEERQRHERFRSLGRIITQGVEGLQSYLHQSGATLTRWETWLMLMLSNLGKSLAHTGMAPCAEAGLFGPFPG